MTPCSSHFPFAQTQLLQRFWQYPRVFLSVRDPNSHPLAPLQERQEKWRRNVLLAAVSSLCGAIARAPPSTTRPSSSSPWTNPYTANLPWLQSFLGQESAQGMKLQKKNLQITHVVSDPHLPAEHQDSGPEARRHQASELRASAASSAAFKARI